jgi:hypothetical protein
MSNSNIDAAFCSTTINECYVFVKDKYVVLNYAPGKPKREIITGPKKIIDRFPMFANTIFENQIDCAFDTTDNNAYFFSGDQCVKTTAPQSTNARLVSGPMLITAMFPTLIGTGFENGINAAMRNHSQTLIHLFKGDNQVVLNLITYELLNHATMKISKAFPPFTGTVFESGIDAAFNAHFNREFYIFKGHYYGEFDLYTEQFINGFIKRIDEDWPALDGILL